MENMEIAGVLSELADLLEIKGSNPFRIRAYRNAIRTINSLTQSLEGMVEEGEDLTELPAVGKDIAGHIEELISTGGLSRLEEVAVEVPRSLAELVKLEGVGPKKVKKLWNELGVTTVDQLEEALDADRVAGLEGFGETSAGKIRRSIEDYRKHAGRFLLSEAEVLIQGMLDYLREADGLDELEVAGSFRRRRETVGDLDLLACAAEGSEEAIMDRFVKFPSVDRVVSAGVTKGAVVLRSGLEVDLRIVHRDSWGAALLYFTGSKEHSVALRTRAVRKGFRVNEWGVFRVPEGQDAGERADDFGERLGGKEEVDAYRILGLEWIPPVLRENRGEVEAAETGSLPALVTLDDIRGDLQMHSTWSDGKASIEEMALRCRELGYSYLAMTDHSPNLAMVRGVTAEKAKLQWSEIEEIQGRLEGITVFRSMEVDILKDGSLDMEEEILAGLDLVVISVHSLMDMAKSDMTDRVIEAMRHPCADILAHPTGRLLNRREPFALDVEAVLQAAAELDVAVELNASPRRLDLSDVHVRRAKDLGVKVAISTDAHAPRSLGSMRFGVEQARRGWLEPGDVLNSMSVEAFHAWLGRRSESQA
ncbi:MAG: DNA polymerase/3'-5' exonuclease PolX [Gemmatimonadota bacterium]|nr:MAG: DNA polymerase/3'-5' exonuclease PolX [Gemmatimonadota bacterium]